MSADDSVKYLAEALERHAEALTHIKHALVYDTLLSTNDEALKLEKSGHASGTLVVALNQLAGRGRLKRPWLTANGNVACSLLLRAEHLPKSHHSLIPLAIALAVRDALHKLHIPLGLKWPNDIVSEDEHHALNDYFYHFLKIGGILIETIIKDGELAACIIGIGLNVKAQAEIRDTIAHAGFLESMRPDITRKEIIKTLMSELDNQIVGFAHSFAKVTRLRYSEFCVTLGKKVAISLGDKEIFGQAVGINDDGALLVMDEKKQHAIYAGDVRTWI